MTDREDDDALTQKRVAALYSILEEASNRSDKAVDDGVDAFGMLVFKFGEAAKGSEDAALPVEDYVVDGILGFMLLQDRLAFLELVERFGLEVEGAKPRDDAQTDQLYEKTTVAEFRDRLAERFISLEHGEDFKVDAATMLLLRLEQKIPVSIADIQSGTADYLETAEKLALRRMVNMLDNAIPGLGRRSE